RMEVKMAKNPNQCARVETFEPRRLLAAPFAHVTADGTLVVTGTPQPDTISVFSTVNDVVAQLGTMQLAFTSVSKISIDAGPGDDVVLTIVGAPSTILGGDGNDKLTGGPAGDSIDGGAGNDT